MSSRYESVASSTTRWARAAVANASIRPRASAAPTCPRGSWPVLSVTSGGQYGHQPLRAGSMQNLLDLVFGPHESFVRDLRQAPHEHRAAPESVIVLTGQPAIFHQIGKRCLGEAHECTGRDEAVGQARRPAHRSPALRACRGRTRSRAGAVTGVRCPPGAALAVRTSRPTFVTIPLLTTSRRIDGARISLAQ